MSGNLKLMEQKENANADCLQRLVRRRLPGEEQTETPLLKAALNRAGYDASEADIVWAWEHHSDDWAAGWLVLDSCGGADGAVKYLLEYLIPESPNQ